MTSQRPADVGSRPGARLFWPEIVDIPSANFATTLGCLANAGLALWLLVLGNMAWLTGSEGTSVWMIPAAGIEAFLAWRVSRGSWRWALVSVADSGIGIAWVLFTRGWSANFTVLGLWALLWRIHGARGTHACRTFSDPAVTMR